MKAIMWLTIVASIWAALGCESAGRPFLRAGGPVAQDGVAVALEDQRCARRTWDRNSDVLDLRMDVLVTNSSSGPVTIVPDQLRLVARGNATVSEADNTPRTVPPGAAIPLFLHFRRVGNAKCNEEMQLSLDRALEVEGHALSVKALSFVPESSDT